MSEDKAKPGQQLAPVRERAVVQNYQPLFDTAQFEHFQRAATALMNSTLLPASVRGSAPAECFSNLILIFEMADRFQMPGTSLAQCVSVVHGKLMLEGKVITAMLESTLGTRLQYHWTGDRGTPGYRIYVWDKSFNPADGDITQDQLDALAPDRYPPGARMIDGAVSDWQTFGKDGRTVNPAWTGAASRNQLAYRGSREWARLYEPGKMLGVYGDDEIMAWEEARVVRADDQPVAISTGFSRPKPEAAAEPAQDADFTDAAPAAESPQDGPGQAEGAGASDDKGDPEPPASEAAGAAGVADQPKAEPKAAPKADPKPRTAPAPVAEPAPDDAAQPYKGLALDAYEAGHAAGVDGQPGDVPHAWANFSDPYAEGWNAGAAERLQDAEDGDDEEGDDEGDDAAAEDPGQEDAAPDQPRDEFDVFQEGVRQLGTWGEVKSALTTVSRSDAWKRATDHSGLIRVRQARISAGLRLAELQADNREALDIQATDLTAFRCWMETVDSADLVQTKWQELVLSPAFQALEPQKRANMEKTVRTRMEELRQPGLGV